ncbi:CMP-N-acetylneuraminate-beta-galactosamide-alpha-2,3-sialyltransferase 4 isoform X1 [Scophthalmus maximus]|uniref:CMP-N-acetylneuraminate-beta-galactosamide-alpha-2,3-sialyltransferase 4 n=2 Tax=Scophthalmus maximus TaxID=52904 RepID=A0A8D2ZMI4_SCOMX|nr:CMP-N-acetylneuraminate-beta-galactosamide-alpha-2,3-sialyltransferase 4 isoform X1 [Scophthalmus maximus]XP_035478620.1 CMP-N-acetylneuraminate-beta-galactosamide-alpha-2,3-sialyltransferase 4 isoform X1 [Scophthalmus maximus]XP_047191576.1 CMP-N-acetylneuraminate-beta-galactosamide-alpha-2,3-sialyltransferase 4 isoform X1 [Scophthalmus maximus]
MSQKATKTWCFKLLPLLLFFIISFVTYYCSSAILQSYGGTSKPLNSSRMLCGGWLTQKKWESLNLNISRRTRLFLQLEDFFWREHLSNLALPYGIKGSELLLLKVLAVTANYQVPANIEKLECRTCVVVGNGFAIKNSSLGSLINQYDVVIRLNDAPVRGYEEDVGNKTTMRLFYPESASYDPGLHNEPGALMVLVPFKQQDLRWLKEILYDEKRVRKGFWRPPPQIWLGDVSKIRVLDPHFLHQTADRLLRIPLNPGTKQKPVHPTTGILAVFVALNYCDVVHVAGFGYPNSKSQRVPIHYYGYDTMRSMKNSYHDLNHEAEALKRLEDSGSILYLHPHF